MSATPKLTQLQEAIMNTITRTLCAATLLSLSTLVSAAPADDANAHFKAIAAGNVDQLMMEYGNNPTMQWVGGKLDGAYIGADKIREVWTKFSKNFAPLEVSVSKLEESINPNGSTVTANVEFKGKAAIKVRYALVYRDGKLVDEVWQIDPKLMTAGY
jgi:hypothetical protein